MDVIDLIEEGENLYENGDSSAAKSKFLKASLLAPEDPQIYNRLGMLEMSRASPDQARIFYQKACTLAPEVARYHMRLGDSLQRLSRYEDAIRAYATSLELEPRNAPAWNNRGFANFNINRWNEALRCYDESMKSDPTYAVAWYNYGYTLQLSGRLNDSKDYYQRAVDLDPSDKIAWNNLANVHYNQGLYERSIDLYKESLKLDETYVIAVNNIGNALDHLHRYDESIYYHEKAIELDSTFHYAWMAKGRALTRLGRPEEGLEFIETSIELDSEDPDYHEALGRCFQSLGLYDKARQIINLGLSVDGQHVPCWVALGDINMDIGNTLQAMQCFDEAVRAQDVLSRNRMRDLDWIEKGRILQTAGVMSLADIFRGFMANESVLTKPKLTLSGSEPPQTNWYDCGVLDCLEFDDENVSQAHIDLAAVRMASANGSAFLRWLSLDRGFVAADENAGIVGGPIGGELQEDGSWKNARPGPGRWSASASWLLVQLDRAALIEAGWTNVWKDAHSEKKISYDDEGFKIGGFRLSGTELILNPPNYTSEYCLPHYVASLPTYEECLVYPLHLRFSLTLM